MESSACVPHGPRSPPRPPPRPAPLHSGLLPSAPNLAKLRWLPPGLSYFLAIFGGFFGAMPASRSARTGYPFRPARLMRSGITRKWRRKRSGSSFKFVRANPAAPGHAGNAGSLHSWPPFPLLPPRPCCACGKLLHPPTPPQPHAPHMRRNVVAQGSHFLGSSPPCRARACVCQRRPCAAVEMFTFQTPLR